MRLVFALYKYFPFGGLQKDMLAIASECAQRGHEVEIICREWSGDKPAHLGVTVLEPSACHISNHRRDAAFAEKLNAIIQKSRPDLLVGFNKIPGVDVYYAADTSFKAKLYRERPAWYRWLPRYRAYVADESRIFHRGSRTHILAISKLAIDEYRQFYQTESERFTLLPPGISRDRINQKGERRYDLHRELELTENNMLVLMVGSGFRTKGLDRAIVAMASLPEETREQTHLVVVGQDNNELFLKQASAAGLEERVHFLGGRKDVPALLCSADLLLHPAYRENTGTVLLEAAVAGLPVIATDVCGYSHYLAENDLGIVLSSPFQQEHLNKALLKGLTSTDDIMRWHHNGLRFAQQADIYSMPSKAVDAIEKKAQAGWRG